MPTCFGPQPHTHARPLTPHPLPNRPRAPPRLPAQRLVVSNCCVKAKGISSIAAECGALTHLVFAVYKVTEPGDLLELQVGD